VSINRLVGERVFGWTVRESEDGDPPHWATSRDTPLARQYHSVPLDSGPHFDREIAAAWEVVEHLRKQRHDDGGRKYLVSMIDHTDSVEIVVEDFREGDSWLAVNESASLAICLAALRAVGVPEATIQEACK